MMNMLHEMHSKILKISISNDEMKEKISKMQPIERNRKTQDDYQMMKMLQEMHSKILKISKSDDETNEKISKMNHTEKNGSNKVQDSPKIILKNSKWK